MKQLCTAGLALLLGIGMLNSASADIVNLGNTAPSVNVLDSQTTRNSFTRAFSFAANANHGRGNVFSLGANPIGGSTFCIDSIVVSKNANQTFDNATLDLFMWEGAAGDWTTGDGATSNTAADIYGSTTVTPLFQETSVLDGTFSTNDFLRIDLTSTVTVSENSDFGFLLTYTPGSSGNDPGFLELDELNGGGGQTRLTDTDNQINANRALTYYVIGTAHPVPEPTSLALLGLGVMGLVARRRR